MVIPKKITCFLFFIVLCDSILIHACSPQLQKQPIPYVILSKKQPLPTLANTPVSLKVAIAAVISPQGTVESYTALLNYLQKRLNRPIELIQRRTYLEVNELIKHGEVDVAFVCTSAYIVGHDQFGMELLAAPQVEEKMTYQSALIVPSMSDVRKLKDLKNKNFAFTDPISFSGRVYPTYLVQQLGSTPEKFFAHTFFTYNHDDAIYAVANQMADGASVDSLVLDYALQRDSSLKEKVRVIYLSPPFGIPPVVVGPAIRPQLKAELEEVFFTMHQDQEGLVALNAINVERFGIIDDNAYQSERDIFYAVQTFSIH